MTENPKKRPRLVMSDVYAYDTEITDENRASGDVDDQTPVLLEKLKKSYDMVKLLEIKLESSDKAKERLRKEAERERNRFKSEIKNLQQETNDAKARSMSLYNQVSDSRDILHDIKKKHLAENDEMQHKVIKMSDEKYQLQVRLTNAEQQLAEYTRSDSSNKRKQQHMAEVYELETQSYKVQIENLKNMTQALNENIQKQGQEIIELTKNQGSSEAENRIDSLCQLNTTLAEKLGSLQVTNKRLEKDLVFYKSNFENTEILKTEIQSLALKVEKLTEVEKEYNSLKIKHTKMEADVNSWYCYISDHDQTPQNYIVNITRELEEARYLKAELNQYKLQISKRDGVVAKMEAYVGELKEELLKKQQVIAAHERASNDFKVHTDMLNHHIDVLKRQLRFYDTEEMEYMNDTYDAIKSHRITELEALLKEYEAKLSESTIKLAQLQSSTINPIEPSSFTPDKTLSLLASQLTQEVESNQEQMRTLYAQDTMLKQELDTTKAQLTKLVEAVGQTTELKDKVHISYTPAAEGGSQGGSTKKMRILEFKENPASTELSRRLAKLNLLEKALETYTQKDLDESEMVPKASLEYQVNEVHSLHNKISTLEKRIMRLNEVFKNHSDQMRDIIKSILGYDVILKSDGVIRVVSDFIDGRDLAFLVKPEDNDGGKLRIIGDRKDDYMPLFEDNFEVHIMNRQSIPAFLGSIVVDLQSSSTNMDEDEVGDYQEDDYQQQQQSDPYYMDDAPMTIQPDYPHVINDDGDDDDDEDEGDELEYSEEGEEEEMQTEGQYAYDTATELANVTAAQLQSLLEMRDTLPTMLDNAVNYNTMTDPYTGNIYQDYESQDEDEYDEEEEDVDETTKPPADDNVITLIDSSDEDDEIQDYEEEEQEEEEEEMPEYEDDEETIVEDDATLHYRDNTQAHHATEYEDVVQEELGDDDQPITESRSSEGERNELLEEEDLGETHYATEELSEEDGGELVELSEMVDQEMENPEVAENPEEMMLDIQENDLEEKETPVETDMIQRETLQEEELIEEDMIQDQASQEEAPVQAQEEVTQEETLQEEELIEEDMVQDEAIQEETPVQAQEEVTQEETLQEDMAQDEPIQAEGQEEVSQDQVIQDETPVEEQQDLTQEETLQEEEFIEEDMAQDEPIQVEGQEDEAIQEESPVDAQQDVTQEETLIEEDMAQDQTNKEEETPAEEQQDVTQEETLQEEEEELIEEDMAQDEANKEETPVEADDAHGAIEEEVLQADDDEQHAMLSDVPEETSEELNKESPQEESDVLAEDEK